MTRIVYVSPDSNVATGGIKVIYQHAQLLNRLGVESHVMHFAEGFRCDWFEHQASIITINQLRPSDIVIVPEIMTVLGNRLQSIGIRYCMFVQNGYLVLPTAPMDQVWDCYKNAAAILSISDDTSGFLGSVFPEFADKIVRVKYSVDGRRFSPEPKLRKVSYMPRKLPHHSSNVVPWLARLYPDWHFQPIHGMHESRVAAELRTSAIFLAFSDFEGCPVPPIEAALAGNVVIGYPGWGGLEYWKAPNFWPVDTGNLRTFVDKFREVAAWITQPGIERMLEPGRLALGEAYGERAEAELLAESMQRVMAMAGAPLALAA